MAKTAQAEDSAALVAIIDDDEAIRNALARLIRTIGYRPLTYGSAEALLADIDGARPACILTDVQMPGMNGFDLIKEVRLRGHSLPIIVMTAYPSLANRERAFAAGAAEYLAKPLDDVFFEAWLLRTIGDGQAKP